VINPANREAKKAQNEMVITGMESDIDLVIMSLIARKKTAATANKVAGLNPSRPGCVTISTPMKPVSTSTQLNPETCCLRINVPPMTTAKGVA
tara:strand:- start:63 stop:341 length:279 start_codon:yes stop_codon:yes gene_type:complete